MLAFAAVSCGGQYTAKRSYQPDEKLAIAAGLFDRGKYMDAVVEYKDFLAVFAGDERADYAQFRIAECYRLDGDYALAAVEYRILINDYGYSEYIDDAFYLEGLCAFEQTGRPEREQSKSYEALSRINRFLQLFPDSPRRDDAMATRAKIYDLLGEKEFDNARLYYSRKHYNAAMVYFDKVIRNYEGTVWQGRSHYYRGRILEERGKAEEALEAYRRSAGSGLEFEEKTAASERIESLTGGRSGER